jgi:hypothetical protein
MSNAPFAIPHESQLDPQIHRGCGAACLSMVYKSFGKEVPQAAIWPLIAKPNRFGAVSSTTHLMALHAISQGLSAVIIQARHPIQVLRICRDAGIRAILNHRLQPGIAAGHYSVLVDVDDKSVVLHDPFFGPSRRISHEELIQLWQPSSTNSEIAGSVLIGIAADPAPIAACEFCHTAIPASMNCARCGKPVALSPVAVLGCVRDGCIARMWNYVACPSCDSLFDESGKPAADTSSHSAAPHANGPEPPNLDKMIAEIDKFCNHLMGIPSIANNADVKLQVDFMRATKDKLKAAQAEQMAGIRSHVERLATFAVESKMKSAEHRKKVEELSKPLPPLDGNALGQALLKNLGFS